MVILVDDKSLYPSGPGVQAIYLDIKLSPSVAERLPFVRWGLILFGVVCLLVGFIFMSLGARPVLGFMGLEVIFLYAAYRYCEGNARQSEHCTVSEQHFIIRTTDRNGGIRFARLDPRWTDLRLVSHERGNGLIVSSKGRSYRLGAFLDLAESLAVLEILDRALRRLPGG